MTDRRKPTAGFWITVALVVVLVGYPLSFGPVCWAVSRAPQWSGPWIVVNFIYSPLLRTWGHDGTIPDAIDWYANFGAAAKLIVNDVDGTVYLCITSPP